MRFFYTYVILMLVVNTSVFGQQEPLYSQYQFNQSMINPAYTGVNAVFNATAVSRFQWVGIQGAPVTHMLNTSTSLLNNKLGVGVTLVKDTYGVNVNAEVQGLVAYRIDMHNGRSLSFGMQAGYNQFKYDYSKLLLEQADPGLSISDGNVSKFNVGAGVYFRTRQYYLGVSVPKMLDTQVSDNGTTTTLAQRHYYISAGFVFDQLMALKFKPSVLIRVVEGQPLSVDLNASVLVLETLWVGASVRNFNTAGVNGQFEISDKLRIGYSFEVPLNSISNNAFGTHELMVSLDLEIFNNHGINRRYF